MHSFAPLATEENDEIEEIGPVKQKKTKIAYFMGNCLAINLPYMDVRLVIGPHWPGGNNYNEVICFLVY